MKAVSKNETYFSFGIDEIKLPDTADFKSNFYLIDAICESIKKDNYEPILIDGNHMIVDGIKRYIALIHLRYKKIKVRYNSETTDADGININIKELPLFAA